MIGINNPLNVRYSPLNRWLGLSDVKSNTKGFCNFVSKEYGVRAAMYLLLKSYPKHGCHSIYQLINRFAPSTENNTQAYVDFVCSHLGVFPFDVPSKPFMFCEMVHYMSIFEGNEVSTNFCLSVYKTFFKA